MNQIPGFKMEPLNEPSCLCGLCVHEAITRIAEAVGSVQRRKKVLLFIGSDMFWQVYRTPGQAYQDPGCERRLEDARTAMFAAVDRANLTVHSIDPQGLVNAARSRPRVAVNPDTVAFCGAGRGLGQHIAPDERPAEPQRPARSDRRPGRGRTEQP